MMTLTCGCEVTVTAPARITRVCEQHGRISLRDHFAGQALASMTVVNQDGRSLDHGQVAERAYEYADAMIAEREK